MSVWRRCASGALLTAALTVLSPAPVRGQAPSPAPAAQTPSVDALVAEIRRLQQAIDDLRTELAASRRETGEVQQALQTLREQLEEERDLLTGPLEPTNLPYALAKIVTELPAVLTRRLDPRSSAALIWGALGFFGTISTAVNYAWGVEKTRSYWWHKLFSFLMLLVAGALLVAATLLVSASQIVGTTWFASVLSQFPGLVVLRGIALRNATTLDRKSVV